MHRQPPSTPPLGLSALVKALVLVAVVATTVLPLSAHGIGTPHRLNVPHGPYLLSVWTDPTPLRADETHVVVAVLEPATQSPIVTGVEVTVTLQPVDGTAAPLTVAAATDDTNRLLYAAEFNDRLTPGRWLVAVSAQPLGDALSGNAPPAAPVTFEIEIAPARGFNWLWIGGIGLTLLVAVWALSAMRPRPRPM